MALFRLSIAFLFSVVSTLCLFGFMRFVITGNVVPAARVPVQTILPPRLVVSPEIEPVPEVTVKPVKPKPGIVVPVVHVVDPNQGDLIDFGRGDWPHDPMPPSSSNLPGGPARSREGGGESPAIDAGIRDRDALPLVRVDPPYPQAAASRGLEGWVHLRFTIAADGAVVDAVVVESSDPIFEKSALRAVAKWRYRPSMRGGLAVEARDRQVLLRFRRPT